MAKPPGPPSWMLVVVMSVYLGTDALQVKYPKAMLLGMEGTSLKLTCIADYVFTDCGLLELSWYQLNGDKSGLTDILKYSTTVNETHHGDSRRRQTVTEFLHLVPEDQGLYQCVAFCTKSGTNAMGHFINITVKGAPAASQLNCGPLSRGSDTSLTVFSLMAAWAALEVANTFI